MRTHIPLLALLWIGCHTYGPVSSSGAPNDPVTTGDPNVDGGTGGPRRPVEVGDPARGADGGVVCNSANTVVEVPLECRAHIPETETPVFINNPPVSGEHYPVWARWQRYATVVPRGYWVHNLEHGGVVFLYRPDAPQSVKEALIRVYDAIPPEQECINNGFTHNRVILTPDPLLDVPWAVTVSGPESEYCVGVGYQIKSDCVASEQALVDFAVRYRNHAIEPFCDDGQWPYPP